MPTYKGLKTGKVTELRCFFHVRPGHEEKLREACRNFVTGAGEAYAIQVGLHDVSMTMFDNDRRFQFATSYDTDWDPYIEDAVRIISAGMLYSVFQHCEEVPKGRADNPPSAEEVKAFLEATRVTALRYVRTYPNASAGDIMKGY